MLIIAAIVAWFATQSPTTEPVAKPEPMAIEAPANAEAKPKAILIPTPMENGNQ